MADKDRTAEGNLDLLVELQDRPFHFDFLQALRRLECLYRDKPRIGTSARPAEDAVRLTQEPSLAFAPATLASFEPGTAGRPWRLASRFFGMFGPNGPLPLHLTEYARDRLRNHDDPTIVRFLDMFHHRMLTLFYRAWADAEPTTHLDRPESDRFATFVGSLLGIGLPTLRHRDAMPDMAKLFFAGRFACQARNKEGLEEALQRIPELREKFWEDVNVPGSGQEFNQSLERAGRIADFLELGELLCWDALKREESCGGHFREEHQSEDGEALRDDEGFSFVSAWHFQGDDREPDLVKEELVYEEIKMATRSYK